jgi:hypothetical protein
MLVLSANARVSSVNGNFELFNSESGKCLECQQSGWNIRFIPLGIEWINPTSAPLAEAAKKLIEELRPWNRDMLKVETAAAELDNLLP